MKRLDWNRLDSEGRRAALERPKLRSDPGLREEVARIVEDVRAGGWDALARIAVDALTEALEHGNT